MMTILIIERANRVLSFNVTVWHMFACLSVVGMPHNNFVCIFIINFHKTWHVHTFTLQTDSIDSQKVGGWEAKMWRGANVWKIPKAHTGCQIVGNFNHHHFYYRNIVFVLETFKNIWMSGPKKWRKLFHKITKAHAGLSNRDILSPGSQNRD